MNNFLAFVPNFSKRTAANIIITSVLLFVSASFAYLAVNIYDQIQEMDSIAAANRCDAEMGIFATEEKYDVGADLCYKTTLLDTNARNNAYMTRVYLLGSFSASFLVFAVCFAINAGAKKKEKNGHKKTSKKSAKK